LAALETLKKRQRHAMQAVSPIGEFAPPMLERLLQPLLQLNEKPSSFRVPGLNNRA
jgi:hypothetical protein